MSGGLPFCQLISLKEGSPYARRVLLFVCRLRPMIFLGILAMSYHLRANINYILRACTVLSTTVQERD